MERKNFVCALPHMTRHTTTKNFFEEFHHNCDDDGSYIIIEDLTSLNVEYYDKKVASINSDFKTIELLLEYIVKFKLTKVEAQAVLSILSKSKKKFLKTFLGIILMLFSKKIKMTLVMQKENRL